MVDVAVVLPTRNEQNSIGLCVEEIRRSLSGTGLEWEVVVADNSDDMTPVIAKEMGAEVVVPDRLGYGYAYRYAFRYLGQKHGGYPKYVVIGDADGTYDFAEIPKLLEPLIRGEADLVIGSRLRGRIERGAMSWLHRYVGNPVLTWFLNLFYRVGVSDAHSGFRAIKGEALEKLELRSYGMEFASEMLMEAARRGLRIVEVPITYRRRRGGRSKLSSLRDGWRHLKFMLIYTPRHLYFYPGVSLVAFGAILMFAALLRVNLGFSPGIHTSIAGSLLVISGFQLLLFGTFASVLLGERLPRGLTLEKVSALGATAFAVGLLWALAIGWRWASSGFRSLPPVVYSVSCLTLMTLGLQTFFASFMLSLVAEQRKAAGPGRPAAQSRAAVGG